MLFVDGTKVLCILFFDAVAFWSHASSFSKAHANGESGVHYAR